MESVKSIGKKIGALAGAGFLLVSFGILWENVENDYFFEETNEIFNPFVEEKNKKTWYGTYSAEAEDCFKYGGGMTTTKNGTSYCSKGTGVQLNKNGSCPDGYLRVDNGYPASKYDGYFSCHEEEYVNSATCEEYWEIEWNRQGYGCSRLNDAEKALVQNEEILANQERILELLGDQ